MFWSTNKAGYHTNPVKDVIGSLVATDWKDPPTVTACNGGGS